MTPDLQSTLDAIDVLAVHRCGQCDIELGPDAPSSLFCSPEHQEAFYAARSEALIGRWEPTGLPHHVHAPDCGCCTEVTYELSPDTTWFDTAIRAAGFRLDAWQERILHQMYETRHAPDIARALAEPDVRRRALEARRNRNTGPQHRQRAPRRIDSRGSR